MFRIATKIEIYPANKEPERFHVMQKDSFFEKWREVGKFKTLKEAEEMAFSRGESSNYKGWYDDKGNRKGMM